MMVIPTDIAAYTPASSTAATSKFRKSTMFIVVLDYFRGFGATASPVAASFG
jgi:hypothetical protein